ncbi:hypothetical protein [Paenarthrobacter sp. C1]|uniref:hypothetical protein n=1 Tax=Paenarthrobacter sp. C1 TaxID=3400220 RepID=UPI003BF53B5E
MAKISSSSIKLTREEELAIRDRALIGSPYRCDHFAAGTRVTIANETYDVLEADATRTTLRLRAADGSERTVLRAGS